jgi:GNAT superfamily N-acetyltransferase
MRSTLLPFSPEHLAPAASLLADRHRRDRCWAPALSEEYEDPAATLPVLRDLLATNGTHGVVALCGGEIAAYLLGAPEIGSPTHPFAGFMHPRAAEMAFAGHAAISGHEATLSPRLYAALAQSWVMNGLVGHYITVPATPDTLETWSDLGFSRFTALGVRSTAMPDDAEVQSAVNLEMRQAVASDEESIQALVTELFQTFADAPIFVPYLPETAAERRSFVADHLADPACPHWLAFANGRLVGMHMFEEPHSTHWHQSKLQSPARSVYLFLAWTAPETRSMGVGAALLNRTLMWAREAGYETCMAHFLTASRAAAFWRSQGFQPVSYWLHRMVDERMTWGCPRA